MFTAVIAALGLLLPAGDSCAVVDGCEQVAVGSCCCCSSETADGAGCGDPATGAFDSGCDCPAVAEREVATVTPRPGTADDPPSRPAARRDVSAAGVDPADEVGAIVAHLSESTSRDEILIENCVLRL